MSFFTSLHCFMSQAPRQFCLFFRSLWDFFEFLHLHRFSLQTFSLFFFFNLDICPYRKMEKKNLPNCFSSQDGSSSSSCSAPVRISLTVPRTSDGSVVVREQRQRPSEVSTAAGSARRRAGREIARFPVCR